MGLFQSCLDDDGYSLGKYWINIATIESQESGSHYFRLDDGTTLWPAAGYYLGHNLEDGQRTLLNYTILSDSLDGFAHYVKVNGIDPILTKKIAKNKNEENDSIYGTDPVSTQEIWIGNGYLNVWFIANFGGHQKHFVNLLQTNEEDPYELEFRHNAYDDPPVAASQGIVCFDLSGLPDTNGETVKLTIRIHTFKGDKTIGLDYNSSDKKGGKQLSNLTLEYCNNVIGILQ
jgi:hypothetical protein